MSNDSEQMLMELIQSLYDTSACKHMVERLMHEVVPNAEEWDFGEFKTNRTLEAMSQAAQPFKDNNIPYAILTISGRDGEGHTISGLSNVHRVCPSSMVLLSLIDILKYSSTPVVAGFIIAAASAIKQWHEKYENTANDEKGESEDGIV